MEWNRVAQVALVIAFYEGGRSSQQPFFPPDFTLSFLHENRLY
jgi:hypothetical protein